MKKPNSSLPGIVLGAAIFGLVAFVAFGASVDTHTDGNGAVWTITQEYGDVDGKGSWFARDKRLAYGSPQVVLRGQTRADVTTAVEAFAGSHAVV